MLCAEADIQENYDCEQRALRDIVASADVERHTPAGSKREHANRRKTRACVKHAVKSWCSKSVHVRRDESQAHSLRYTARDGKVSKRAWVCVKHAG